VRLEDKTVNLRIIQPAGLGDIFFCLKIARYFIDRGYKIYWPVIPQYSWIKDYINIDNLYWTDNDKILIDIDIQSAGHYFPNTPIMNAKYKMVELEWEDWLDYFTFNRNKEKEDELYKQLVVQKPYCLVCDTFASPPGAISRLIPIDPDILNISITTLPGYTPFDWCRIIEEAEELRLVDTCFTYFVEKLDVQAKKMSLYSRDGKAFYTNHIWTKPWEYIL
jgi:hypothetical protein